MKIPCYKHEGQQILFIRFDKNKTEYVCDECFIGLESSTLEELIHIKNALKSPEYFLSKLNLTPDVKEYLTDLDKQNDKKMNGILMDLKNQITKIQKQLQDVYEEIEQNLNNFRDMKQKIRDELIKITKFDQFTQLIMDLEKLGDSINPQAIEQSENLLQQYLQDLTQKDSQELNSNLISMLKEIQIQPKDPKQNQQQNQYENKEDYPKYKELDLLNQQFNQSQIKFVDQSSLINFERQIGLKQVLPTNLLSNYQRQKIIYTIQSKLDKTVRKCQVKFQSSREGLNIQSFWNNLNGNPYLLMIFKSRSGYIFGGFSPCQWQQQQQQKQQQQQQQSLQIFNNLQSQNLLGQNLLGQNQYIQDDTLSSFIFSQTHDQIYPLKQAKKSQAICCSAYNGIAFGSDLIINQNFQDGSSCLGETYYWDKYQKKAQSIHLFGQQTPNITALEVYQVILT